MKIILRTYDFIKSWKYYPIMKKYLEEKCHVKCPYSRLRYALWHCKQGILSDVNLKYRDVKIKDVSEVWGNVYKLRPIEK